MTMPQNIYISDEALEFWVWVNPSNWLVKHQISLVGSFISAGNINRGESNLPFIPNPKFTGDVSHFSIGVTHHYTAEYNFEINREQYFQDYPSRLNAIYLLRSESEAEEYQKRHMGVVSEFGK